MFLKLFYSSDGIVLVLEVIKGLIRF